MILIYTYKITKRNKYVFNLIFKDVLGVDFQLTTDEASFINHKGAKLSYTNTPLCNELFFN